MGGRELTPSTPRTTGLTRPRQDALTGFSREPSRSFATSVVFQCPRESQGWRSAWFPRVFGTYPLRHSCWA